MQKREWKRFVAPHLGDPNAPSEPHRHKNAPGKGGALRQTGLVPRPNMNRRGHGHKG
ncbi:MAG: hypothetical protein JSS66_03060 [Armatimonadetes bacterium]|nr:hypothetical protein [Armatimonadota bacterium]